MNDVAPPSAVRNERLIADRRWSPVLLGVIALCVAAAIALAVGWRALQPEAPTAPKEPDPPPGTFRASPSQYERFDIQPAVEHVFRAERTTEGKIAINQERTTPVYSPYSGRVVKIEANLGDRVRAGKPLLVVEASEFIQGQNDLVTAVAALGTARAQQAQAEITEARKRAMYEAKAGALQDWQQAQADLASARNAYRSAETALNLVRNRLRILGKSDAEIERLEKASRIDPDGVVVAPIAGTIIDRQVGMGQFIQSGSSTPLFSIGDLSTVWLVANVREADAPQMKVGAPVEVRVLAFPDKVYKARITYVAPTVDPATRRVTVRAEVQNPDGELKPEMFASFAIGTGGASASPAVPASAIVYEGDRARVWVAQDDRLIELREIRAGRSDGSLVEVVQGLKPGERVVTSGTLFIDRAARRPAG